MSASPPIDVTSIDTAVHGPVRLGVLTALQAEGALDFTQLKKRLSVTDGAIGMHLQKLEGIGYVTCTKQFIGRRPKSIYALSEKGRAALFQYLEMMQQLINSLSPSLEESPTNPDPDHEIPSRESAVTGNEPDATAVRLGHHQRRPERVREGK